MKRIYILSTCDDWKSRGSMIRYYVGSSDKAGTRRMLAAIKKGIREHIFCWATNGEKVPVLEQIEDFQNDVKFAGATVAYEIQSKLEGGSLELVEFNSYQ